MNLLIKESPLVPLDHKLLIGFILRFDLLCDLLRPGEAFAALDGGCRVVKHALNDLALGVGFECLFDVLGNERPGFVIDLRLQLPQQTFPVHNLFLE